MFYFQIAAKPLPESDHAKEGVGGAYVSVWVNFPHDEGAEAVARFYVEDAGWLPGLTLEASEVSESDFVEENDRKYFDETMENGACLVFHQWPLEADDADVEYEVN